MTVAAARVEVAYPAQFPPPRPASKYPIGSPARRPDCVSTPSGKQVVRDMCVPHTPSRFRLRLHGSPVLTGPSGARVDIKSKRALALLAMLAVAPGQERQRAWLVGQLWSTREHAQALGSLRQELHVLRQTTGLHGDLIGSDHSRVWILEDGLELEQPEHGANAQFLEGIDIPGAEGFEEWLRDVRGAVDIPSLPPETHRGGTKAPSATSPRPLVIEIVLTSPAPQAGRGNALCAMLGRSLHEAGGIQVQIGGTPSGALPPDLRVLVDLQEFAEEALASLMVHRVFDGALLVSYSAALPASSTSGDSPMRMLSAFASTAVDQILNALIRDKAVFESERFLAARAATEGFLTLFSRRDDAALKADRCFAEAVDAFDDAAFYAGWAYLGALLLEEQPRSSHAEIRERAREYAARAEELDPQNGLAAALLTHVHAFVLRDLTRAEAFNERALALRPAHVLTQDATALLHLYRGNASSARAAANSAEELGKLLPYRYALATTKAMIETVSGNYKLGLQEAERALALQPLAATRPYPPILRYMGICQAELAHLEEAQRTFESLEKQEGQLRLTSLNPEDYPVPSPDAMQLMRRSVGRLKREDP